MGVTPLARNRSYSEESVHYLEHPFVQGLAGADLREAGTANRLKRIRRDNDTTGSAIQCNTLRTQKGDLL